MATVGVKGLTTRDGWRRTDRSPTKMATELEQLGSAVDVVATDRRTVAGAGWSPAVSTATAAAVTRMMMSVTMTTMIMLMTAHWRRLVSCRPRCRVH